MEGGRTGEREGDEGGAKSIRLASWLPVCAEAGQDGGARRGTTVTSSAVERSGSVISVCSRILSNVYLFIYLFPPEPFSLFFSTFL